MDYRLIEISSKKYPNTFTKVSIQDYKRVAECGKVLAAIAGTYPDDGPALTSAPNAETREE